MKKSFTHELIEGFKYSAKGEFHNAEIITVDAPKSSEFYENLQFLDSLVNKSEMRMMKNLAGVLKELNLSDTDRQTAQKQNEEKSETEQAYDAYNQLISGLEKDEIKQLNIAIVELLKKSAKVDGEKNFEDTFWDDIGIEDKRLIIGEYVVNFTASSQRSLKKE